MSTTFAAYAFGALTSIVILFQGCLAAGLPWGAASMGGKFPGKYPTKMRWVAVLNMLLLALIASIVLIKAGLLFPDLLSFARIGIWFVLLFCLLGTVANTITPSKIERIWAPVALLQFVTALVVALN